MSSGHSSAVITDLGLPWYYRDISTLGDGSEVVFEIYKASVIWDGQEQIIDVAASDADPLVGMGLLYGFKLQIEAKDVPQVTTLIIVENCALNKLSEFAFCSDLKNTGLPASRVIVVS